MNEKLVVVKNTISSEDLAAQMKKMGCAGNGGRAKEFDLEEELAKAGVPEVVVKVMAFEGFDECRIPLAVKNWVEGYSGKGTSSLWLSGGSGAGKSTAAAWAVKGIVEASGEPESLADGCKFVAVSDLVHGTWMGSGLYGEGNKWRLIEPLTTCPLLVLDDLGSCVRQGREECSVVREVVDKRWGHMLPTIYTTQYGLEEYCNSLVKAGADIHDTTSMANRIIASLGNYVGRDDRLVKQHFVPIRWPE